MERGYEEVSSSQAGRRRVTPWEMIIASSLVAAIFAEELRLYSQIPAEINLEVSDSLATSTVREVDNAIYFTREQFIARLRFLVPSLVKQFMHFTRAPSTLIHPNVFRILMVCSVLNSLDQLDISLMEICFIYHLKLRIEVRLSMSANNPWLQFVTRLPDSQNGGERGCLS